jgi:hypothetical protein
LTFFIKFTKMQRIERYRDISVGREQDLHCELKARVVLKSWMSGQAAGCDASDPLRGHAIDALCTGKDGAGEEHGKKDARLVKKICGGLVWMRAAAAFSISTNCMLQAGVCEHVCAYVAYVRTEHCGLGTYCKACEDRTPPPASRFGKS